jgi:hypothetical protein
MRGAHVHIAAGICGIETTAVAQSDADQAVTFQITSGCSKIQALAKAITGLGPVDAVAEIDARKPGALTSTMRNALSGCCSGCAVPVGIFKSMQVSAGLALPRAIHIDVSLGEA